MVREAKSSALNSFFSAVFGCCLEAGAFGGIFRNISK
jgi:hypothetical protein